MALIVYLIVVLAVLVGIGLLMVWDRVIPNLIALILFIPALMVVVGAGFTIIWTMGVLQAFD